MQLFVKILLILISIKVPLKKNADNIFKYLKDF